MRDLPEAFEAHLKTGATTLCRCWCVTRLDGQKMGFTDHDGALSFEGVSFEPATGMDATALESATGLSVDNSEVVGVLNAAGLTEEDIEAGLYDGAEILQYIVNWQDVEQRLLMFRGTLGEIKRGSGAFEAELRSLSEALNQPIGRAYLRQCDAQLGDGRCQVDVSNPAYTSEATLTHFTEHRVLHLSGLQGYDEGWFTHGQITFVNGANADVSRIIKVDKKQGDTRILETWEAFRHPAQPGETVQVTAGCDKDHGTCRLKFANLLNFRGFPHMPGEDWAVSYPVRGGQNDGGALR